LTNFSDYAIDKQLSNYGGFKMAHQIKKEECINCGACEGVCPVQCITEVDHARLIDVSVCVDCGACKDVCPVACIKGPND